ncbi:peptidylprolyl isomerase [Nocardioides sp.]|uniref:peptidylprolyl isomerase n=1 Tax=Nocardioides sp. TaxID=35761 RepID=UPI00261558E1|nr:peptidylprolyl isomerase [Nocardioides sp.]
MLKRPVALAVLALAAATTLTACGSGSDSGAATAKDGVTCSYPSSGTAAAAVTAPGTTATASGTTAATLKLSAGDVPLTLENSVAPCTVNSFVSLAKQGYFDNTPCHRLTTSGIYVLQCGDPSGTGSGGPGYSFDDELEGAKALQDSGSSKNYAAGTLAMANAGANTNGSQFFLVYADSPLPPAYTVFGKVSAEGLSVLTAIAKKGTVDGGGDGAPKDAVTITSLSVG